LRTVFTYSPIFEPGLSDGLIYISLLPTPIAIATNFVTQLTITRLLQKNNCTLFSPTPYFRVWAMQWCHVNFSPENPCCHVNQPFLFKDKIGCSRHCYITHNFFLVPTSFTGPEVFWKQWINLLS